MRNVNLPISAASVRELQTILREDYGADMSFKETATAATAYLNYFDTLAEMVQGKNKNYHESPIHKKTL